jgi:hypothetical protein
MQRQLDAGPLAGLYASMREKQPHLFSHAPVFISQRDVQRMQAVIAAIEEAVNLPGYRQAAGAWLPAIAKRSPGARGVFFGYDFHLGARGPQLIEVNTNAGGAYLNIVLARAQRECCREVRPLMNGPYRLDFLEDVFVEMFRREWSLQRGEQPLHSVAIVDDAPAAQYLYPEFLLFRELFERAGLQAVIVDAAELRFDGGRLHAGNLPIDLVYNRATDFYLVEARHAALREAYEADAVVLTPHPHAYGKLADKRNLPMLADGERLAAWGLSESSRRALAEGIPPTYWLDPADGARWWRDRKRYFFKPVSGYGSKAAYRGDKLTKGAWAEILQQDYVAQALVPPSERTITVDGKSLPLKLDVRNYTYDAQVQLLAARLYQGQTTNFRTPGGGFAPVYTESPAALAVDEDHRQGCC